MLDLSLELAMPAIAADTRNGAVSGIVDLPESSLQPPPKITEEAGAAALAVANDRLVRIRDIVCFLPEGAASAA